MSEEAPPPSVQFCWWGETFNQSWMDFSERNETFKRLPISKTSFSRTQLGLLWNWNASFGIASMKSTWVVGLTSYWLQTRWILEKKSQWRRTRVVVQVGPLERISKFEASQSSLLPLRRGQRYTAIYRWRNDVPWLKGLKGHLDN